MKAKWYSILAGCLSETPTRHEIETLISRTLRDSLTRQEKETILSVEHDLLERYCGTSQPTKQNTLQVYRSIMTTKQELDTFEHRVVYWERWIIEQLDIVNECSIDKLVELKIPELDDENIKAILAASDALHSGLTRA
jgi:ribosomal protein S10